MTDVAIAGGMHGAEASVFEPGKHNDDDVHYGEYEKFGRVGNCVTIDLIDEKKEEGDDRGRIGPPLPEKERAHQPRLYDAVPEQVDRSERLGAEREVLCGVEEVVRYDVPRILYQFVVSYQFDDIINALWAYEEQQCAADGFEHAVQSFHHHTDGEEQVNDSPFLQSFQEGPSVWRRPITVHFSLLSRNCSILLSKEMPLPPHGRAEGERGSPVPI